ncbi:hypothetical protein HJG60_008332 [Phyllostomus discolor]|uniref:Uncharacterized protein n=1 Tax=Phyllostomus discolor TaxID=89673 RepID=A0A833Z6Y0_9CHIR|nr:hypothetical protein HJG60_008332 [Phyllostomus discolor]
MSALDISVGKTPSLSRAHCTKHAFSNTAVSSISLCHLLATCHFFIYRRYIKMYNNFLPGVKRNVFFYQSDEKRTYPLSIDSPHIAGCRVPVPVGACASCVLQARVPFRRGKSFLNALKNFRPFYDPNYTILSCFYTEAHI